MIFMELVATNLQNEQNQTQRTHQATHLHSHRMDMETIQQQKAHYYHQTDHQPDVQRVYVFV